MTLDSRKKSLLAACCLGALIALAPASAQTAASPIRVLEKASGRVKTVDATRAGNKDCVLQSISCGQTVSGALSSSDCALTDGSYADYYEFNGTSGQDVTATMRSSSVDSYLALLDPHDHDVQENDNGAGGNDARITYRLDSNGKWAIAATSYSPRETGPYTLTLTCSGSTGTVPAAPSRLQATAVSSTEIDLTWRDNSNNETGFLVEALIGGTFQQIGTVSANATRAGIVNLTPQTSYTFRVRAVNGNLASAPSNQVTATTPAGGGGNDGYLTSSAIPNFRFKVRTFNQTTPMAGVKENDCIPETLCVSDAVPGRSEVFLRVIGPRPNGYLWPTIVRFTPSRVEVDIQQISTGITKTYVLPAVPPGSDELSGLQDRMGFLP
ncbi:MAG TPA: fibronectin type III domain-containing protein [Thermoanaerobaculia bacterium]|nr:fibronectin type III domain-containing protein [Thermoanaerobaculia bacterium]